MSVVDIQAPNVVKLAVFLPDICQLLLLSGKAIGYAKAEKKTRA